MARTAAEVVNTFLTRAQDAARKDYHGRLRELLNQSEGRPNISDPECFSFWIANLLPIRTAERLQFLRLTDTREVCITLNFAGQRHFTRLSVSLD
jgi:hypothetical protein